MAGKTPDFLPGERYCGGTSRGPEPGPEGQPADAAASRRPPRAGTSPGQNAVKQAGRCPGPRPHAFLWLKKRRKWEVFRWRAQGRPERRPLASVSSRRAKGLTAILQLVALQTALRQKRSQERLQHQLQLPQPQGRHRGWCECLPLTAVRGPPFLMYWGPACHLSGHPDSPHPRRPGEGPCKTTHRAGPQGPTSSAGSSCVSERRHVPSKRSGDP